MISMLHGLHQLDTYLSPAVHLYHVKLMREHKDQPSHYPSSYTCHVKFHEDNICTIPETMVIWELILVVYGILLFKGWGICMQEDKELIFSYFEGDSLETHVQESNTNCCVMCGRKIYLFTPEYGREFLVRSTPFW